MATKVNLDALAAARDGLRYALATYLRVAVDYRLISRTEADEMISEPDRAFPVFAAVEKSLSARKRQGHYMDAPDEVEAIEMERAARDRKKASATAAKPAPAPAPTSKKK